MYIMIRDACLTDATAICAIYNHYILGTIVTFEEAAVSWDSCAALSGLKKKRGVGRALVPGAGFAMRESAHPG
jgi:L-amino acid N-acyltransferase YncA